MRIGLATKSKGFTLIELLIAVTIIGILAAAVSIGYVTHLRNASCSRILQDFDAISKAAQTHREVTGAWAPDVNPNPALSIPIWNSPPIFVPEYMPTWPSGDFYADDAYYDWELWLKTLMNFKAISFRIPTQDPISPIYFYCIQDDTAPNNDPTNDCRNNPSQTPPVALNRGGTCP